MVRYLIHRPIAVLISFFALIIVGLYLVRKIPVSLLPNIDVPQIVIRVDYPNMPARVIEYNILKPIRENLLSLNNVMSIESKAANHTGLIYLKFEYGSKMDLAFIQTNEKLDRITNLLPKDVQRPQIIRTNTSDIPIINIQVIPKDGVDYFQVSTLVEKNLRKRIEQIDGVSLIDINGLRDIVVSIIPSKSKLVALGISENNLISAINSANLDIGGLNIKDGNYSFFVKLSNRLESINSITNLPILNKNGKIVILNEVAEVNMAPKEIMGYHLYNGKEGLVITVQKQTNSRMNELVPKIKNIVKQFQIDYPQVDFYTSQDQTYLLDAGINNLQQDLIYGGLLTVIILFLFLGNLASPILMSISIPVSLIITFIIFYLFDISFNIISLSGLALGIGMLIDNSIIVIDNITRKRAQGFDMIESSVNGTNEVIVPVISQVLTTVAVYLPLVLMSGMAGSLIYDQSIALTISLFVSLLVAFVLAPLLYKLLLKSSPEKLNEDTIFYKWIANGYHRMISHILKYRLLYFVFTIILMPIGFFLLPMLPISSMPKIEKNESLIEIDWNSSLDAQENMRRTKELINYIKLQVVESEAEIGIKQFLLQQDNNAIQKSEIYYKCKNEVQKNLVDSKVLKWGKERYKLSKIQIFDAANAFNQIFSNYSPYFEVRLRKFENDEANLSIDPGLINILNNLPNKNFKLGDGLMQDNSVELHIDYNKMRLYNIDENQLNSNLQQLFGLYIISTIKQLGDSKPIVLQTGLNSVKTKLESTISNRLGIQYPLNDFISFRYTQEAKYYTADKSGVYQSLILDKTYYINDLQERVSKLAALNGYQASFGGKVFDNQKDISQLYLIFLLVLGLLYIILAIQYESLIQPFIVMLTIPLGLTGSIVVLWFTGGSIDVMSAIGFIVILGLIVDDPILKVEILNRLYNKYKNEGIPHNDALLEKIIHEAGDFCLKPLLMVSLTTSIALVPVLFIGGIGNDLQKPLSYVIIGGLTIGTFFTTWFIPLAFWYYQKIIKWKNSRF